ncbi:hypothetical protein ASU31_25760 [Pedobacter ginsenosidimutans]|uniref:Thoeris protein ThsB TIR-like domain-containing protein n=1 Tax=Pedobacter ginsenosidimutans TaxID=687842 RepID=A0A0T5VHC2_9SPHI|nr:TIR domain-containing protein [Pedobacter ginsenosidimutans]KRT13210.1 hypothetical protein ASU31_25760 [Pedobacter ginsenosidimutans]
MARKVFFSFHYDNDVWRAMNVRNSWVTKPDTESAGYIDHADFEKILRQGEQAVKRWIDDQLFGSSVTIVLLGAETLQRPFVKYELEKSYARGNAIIGIFVNKLKNAAGETSSACSIYGCPVGKNASGDVVNFSSFPIYDWVDNNGYTNLGSWVELAINTQKR